MKESDPDSVNKNYYLSGQTRKYSPMHHKICVSRWILSLSCIIIIFTSCHFTTTTTNTPTFSSGADSMSRTLNKLIVCQNINVTGKVSKTDGQVSAEIDIEVLNASNLSSNAEDLRTLGNQIAVTVKKYLASPKDYNTFKVIFVAQKTSGSVSVTSSRSFDYDEKSL